MKPACPEDSSLHSAPVRNSYDKDAVAREPVPQSLQHSHRVSHVFKAVPHRHRVERFFAVELANVLAHVEALRSHSLQRIRLLGACNSPATILRDAEKRCLSATNVEEPARSRSVLLKQAKSPARTQCGGEPMATSVVRVVVVACEIRRHRVGVAETAARALQDREPVPRFWIHSARISFRKNPGAHHACRSAHVSPLSLRPSFDKNLGAISPRRFIRKAAAAPRTPTPYSMLRVNPIEDESEAYTVGHVTSAIRNPK